MRQEVDSTTAIWPLRRLVNISQMYVDCPCMVEDSFLLKNASGCLFCKRIAPIPTSEASALISNGKEKSGKARTGGVVKTYFKFANASEALEVYVKPSFVSKSVSGAATVA